MTLSNDDSEHVSADDEQQLCDRRHGRVGERGGDDPVLRESEPTLA